MSEKQPRQAIENKKTLVIGATPFGYRYANQAVERLLNAGIEVVPLGIREGRVHGLPILHGEPPLDEVHTISMYINPSRQRDYYDYILKLRPKRIIFNPGSENPELARMAREQGISVLHACTLVMLATDSY